MYDPRYDAYADLICELSLAVEAGKHYTILSTTEARPLVLALQKRINRTGAFPHLLLSFPESEEIRYGHASDEQLGTTGILEAFAAQRMDGILLVHSDANPAANAQVPLERQMLALRAMGGPMQTVFTRVAEGSLRWASCVFPGRGFAQLAGMGDVAYEEMVFAAVMLDEASPVAAWERVAAEQQRIIDAIAGGDRVHITGEETDLTLSVAGRKWINAAGRSNLPDGEIYSGPVETSLNGHIYFRSPIMYKGNIAEHVRLVFEDGRCAMATAGRGEEYLNAMIRMDAGSAYCGEFAIGTNYGITTPTGHILVDEKMGGTIHLALGNGYPLTGSRNVSALHWDFICDLRSGGRVEVDGATILEDGRIRV